MCEVMAKCHAIIPREAGIALMIPEPLVTWKPLIESTFDLKKNAIYVKQGLRGVVVSYLVVFILVLCGEGQSCHGCMHV